MFSTTTFVAASFLAGASLMVSAQQITVASPASLVQCQPVALSWAGGAAPYYVSIIPGGNPSGAAMESFDTTSATSLTWIVNLAAGQDVTVKVVDSTGAVNYSSQIPIQTGSTTECVGTSASAVAGGAASSATSVASAATSRAASSASSVASAASSVASSVASDASSAARRPLSTSSTAPTTATTGTGIAGAAAASPTSATGAGVSSAKLATAGLAMTIAAVAMALVA